MDEKSGMPSEQELKEFMGLRDHQSQCAYFHNHPALTRVYRAAHFPKPAETVAIAAPEATLSDTTKK